MMAPKQVGNVVEKDVGRRKSEAYPFPKVDEFFAGFNTVGDVLRVESDKAIALGTACRSIIDDLRLIHATKMAVKVALKAFFCCLKCECDH